MNFLNIEIIKSKDFLNVKKLLLDKLVYYIPCIIFMLNFFQYYIISKFSKTKPIASYDSYLSSNCNDIYRQLFIFEPQTKPIHSFLLNSHPKKQKNQKNTTRIFINNCNSMNNNTITNNLNISFPITFARCDILPFNYCGNAPYLLDFLYHWYDNLTEETIVLTNFYTNETLINKLNQIIIKFNESYYYQTKTFGGFPESQWQRKCNPIALQDIYPYVFINTSMPRFWFRFSINPISTFFIKTKQIRKHTKKEFATIYNNIIKWSQNNNRNSYKYCDLLFENTWHLILDGKNLIEPPTELIKKSLNFSENSTDYCKFPKKKRRSRNRRKKK